jgi:sRNA-binding regulator protein Hfq
MEPQVGQFVRLFFRNGIQLEGIIEKWSNAESVLKPNNDENRLLIMQTKQDVMICKIIANHVAPEELPKKLNELVSQFQEVYEQPSNDDLRTKSLAQLKMAMNKQEKQIIANKLKQHTPSNITRVNYGNPFTKSSP